MKIHKLRKNIDEIDKALLKLFEKRMKNSIEIAKYKIAHHQNVKDLKREKEIFKKIQNSSNKKFVQENMLLFSVIMYISKNLQHQKFKACITKNLKGRERKNDFSDKKADFAPMEGKRRKPSISTRKRSERWPDCWMAAAHKR